MTAPGPINPDDAAFARKALLSWFNTGIRSFPWRGETEPYHVLMAEMMLRRTRASQVVPVYLRFIAAYPTVIALANAPSDEIAEILYPLGLAWRAANFQNLARELVNRYKGQIPRKRDELLALPGVGPYVADAVRCFAFGEVATLVDTNTVRVTARYFGFEYNQESRRRSQVIANVAQLIEPDAAIRSNYALLDFAATICRAINPAHKECPLVERCAFNLQLQNMPFTMKLRNVIKE